MLKEGKLFKKFTDPISGVESYVMENFAPMMLSFYFTQKSMTSDGKKLWFYYAYPPAGNSKYGRMLGVTDIETEEVMLFPETQFSEASPLLDEDTGEVYWVSAGAIYKRGCKADDVVIKVSDFDSDLIHGRSVAQIACHLTFNSSKTALLLYQ
jgi:hypothetical protein